MPPSLKVITVGARASPLSRIQVQEVLKELQEHYPTIQFVMHYMETTGDLDHKTSLRDLDKTNFFTKEIDQEVLSGRCRIGVHSAKDLPSPIPKGLTLVCLTKGLSSADSLVMNPGMTVDSLPKHAKIATSSLRREECVKLLRKDLTFCDIRGTIDQRLSKLHSGEVDGVVIAEAALIRLNLTHLNRITLPGPTAEGQGQLAVVAKDADNEMKQLFACMTTQ